MKNLTVSLSEAVLDRLRVLAAQRRQSVNRYVGEILNEVANGPTVDWEESHTALFDQIKGLRSEGAWTRQDIYEGRPS